MTFKSTLATTVLGACVSTIGLASSAFAMTVAFINPGGDSGFWGNVSGTMQAAADDFGHHLQVIHTNRDRKAFHAAAQDLAARANRPDYVILVNEIKQGKKAYETLAEAGIDVLFLLNPLSAEEQSTIDTAHLIGGISPDNEIAGYEMAKSLINAARSSGKDSDGVQIMALLGDLATPASVQRTKGLERAVAEESDATLVRSFPVNWQAEEAAKRTAKFLESNSVDGIWSANDPIALAAQDAAKAQGAKAGQDIFFAGLNWSRPALEAVKSGEMTMTHGGHFFAGAWSIVLLNDLDARKRPVRDIRFPMSAVTAENADVFLERLGRGDWGRIDFTQFSAPEGPYDFSAEAILRAAE